VTGNSTRHKNVVLQAKLCASYHVTSWAFLEEKIEAEKFQHSFPRISKAILSVGVLFLLLNFWAIKPHFLPSTTTSLKRQTDSPDIFRENLAPLLITPCIPPLLPDTKAFEMLKHEILIKLIKQRWWVLKSESSSLQYWLECSLNYSLTLWKNWTFFRFATFEVSVKLFKDF